MMPLAMIYPDLQDQKIAATSIGGLAVDSRKVVQGDLYAALPGSVTDGALYIDDAKKNGAVAVLALPQHETKVTSASLAFIGDPNPRRALALMASRFYAGQPDHIAAVTGTNGKTSVAGFLAQIWRMLDLNAASMGTLGVHGADIHADLGHTTADPIAVHKTLQDLEQAGVTHLALEASSHGLDQHRLDGVRVQAGAFTNLSRDHLDYHETVEAYFEAKCRLFSDLIADGGAVVLNLWRQDQQLADRVKSIADSRGLRLLTVGTDQADLALVSMEQTGAGSKICVHIEGNEWSGFIPLIGDFQVSNLLVAAGLAITMGADLSAVLNCLPQMQGIDGRMQHVGTSGKGASVLVDYAHTPDGLATALSAARQHCVGKLICVFGCGGDRDTGKRPQMGKVAGELSDHVIVTDDNPRSEDPTKIRDTILAAVPAAQNIGDREAAIKAAIDLAQVGDIVLIAGKGHEQGQIIGNDVLPFDDRVVARNLLGGHANG